MKGSRCWYYVDLNSPLSKEKMFGRAAIETLVQTGCIAIIIVLIEALNVSMLYIPRSIFRSLLETALILVALVIGSLFFLNTCFFWLEFAIARRWRPDHASVVSAFLESVSFLAFIYTLLHIMNVLDLMWVWLENPLPVVISVLIALITLNYALSKAIPFRW